MSLSGPSDVPAVDGRRYRSKKQRPCDLCRSRKTHCKLPGDGNACELCQKLVRPCTFLHQPLKRRRHNSNAQSTIAGPTDKSAEAGAGLDIAITDMNLSNPAQQGVPDVLMDESPFWFQDMELGDLSALNAPNAQNFLDGSPEALRYGTVMDALQDGNNMSTSFLPSPPPWLRISASSPDSSSLSATSLNGSARRMGPPNPTGHNRTESTSSNQRPNISSPDSAVGWSHEFALESRPGYSHHYIGSSCESDPYLLRNYLYDEVDIYHMFRLDFRKIQDDASLQPYLQPTAPDMLPPQIDQQPIQFVMTSEHIWKNHSKFVEQIQSGSHSEADDLARVNELVSAKMGTRLVNLYMKYVHPRFPVLSLADLASMPYREISPVRPVGIEAAVYALAVSFSFLDHDLSILKGYDQIPADELWAVAHRSYQRASCFSHLSGLQLCLLLLQTPPQNFAVAEPLSTWALSCSALSIAENLGLNLDPTSWKLPRKEIMLRRRLWWLTYKQHIWHAVVLARPSHTHDDNWDVAMLTQNDFEVAEITDTEVQGLVDNQVPIYIAQCELSIIAADILSELYSLRAVKQTCTLGDLLQRAQPLRARIESWRQSLPLLSKSFNALDEQETDTGIAVRLSHLTLEALISRALLRPLFYQAVAPEAAASEPISTIFQNCYTCARVGVDIVASLKAKHFSSFWDLYARHQLCYFSDLMLMTLTQAPTKEIAMRSKALLDEWQVTLRTLGRAWPFARLATIRLDAAVWKGLKFVVHGAGESSPAFALIKELEAKNSTSPPASNGSVE